MARLTRPGLALLTAFAMLFAFGLPNRLLAQDAATVATPAAAGITLAANDVPNPRGITWNADGTMFVGSGGIGGETPAPKDETGSVLRIDQRCPVPVASGFPSASAFGGRYGISDVAILDNTLYALGDGGFDVQPPTPAPDGLYRINPDGSWQAIANIGAWVEANPTASIPGDADPGGEPFSMVSDGEAFWISESNHSQILRVTPQGAITRVVDLSKDHPVPTGLALAPDGGIYVGYLTSAPFADGSSKVVKITADGHVTDVWTGLTAVTAVAVAADGTLYALEMSTQNGQTPPFYRHGTGRVVRQTGPSSLDPIVVGLDQPVRMGFGPDGGLYVAFPAHDAEAKPGAIIRVDPNLTGSPATIPAGLLESTHCPAPMAATPAAVASGVAVTSSGVAPGAVSIDIKIDVPTTGSGAASPACSNAVAPIPPTAVAATDAHDNGAPGAVTIDIKIDVPTTATCGPPVTTMPAMVPTTAPAPTTVPPAATPAAATNPESPSKVETGPAAIGIKNFAFNPASVTIRAGTVVTWTNNDSVAHTASATGGEFNSGNLSPGQSFSFKFEKAGTFDYVCIYHPYMKGAIVVE